MQWTLYENYFRDAKQAYQTNYSKVHSFNEINDLLFLLSQSVYSNFMNFFSNYEEKKIKVYHKIDAKTQQEIKERVVVEALSIFRDNILPVWEDPKNKYGGQIQLEFKLSDWKKVNQFYIDFVLEVCGVQNAKTDNINGIRVLDKLRSRPASVRVEVWLNYNPKDEQYNTETKQIIEIINEILQQYGLEVEMKIQRNL